ncbi:hypothetical protein [Xanthomarina gelatinilytica]|uniref:hypothetical protein n=1 Tax=Xanthomarina gelatinilytica TaxID=1137281 RepID=UPI003A886944
MNELHKQSNSIQRPTMHFSEEALYQLKVFALAIKEIHMRMISEGYEMIDGKIVKVANPKNHEVKNNTK